MPTKKVLPKSKRLFSVPDEYRKQVYQPNNITKSVYSYTLIQERIFNYMVYWLQTYMVKVMNGTQIQQLDLFHEVPNQDYIDIDIPMYLIAKPRQYNEVRIRALEMTTTAVKVETKRKNGEKIDAVQPIIVRVELEHVKKRTAILPIRMSKEVAMMMLNIERSSLSPINYTSFMLDVALSMGNKYSPRLYKLMSSWKEKGFYFTTIDALRSFLDLGNKYKNYETLKRCILLPVQQELKDKADIYFELSETKEHNRVVKLNFVIKPNNQGADESNINYRTKQWETIVRNLRNGFKLDDKGISLISKIKDTANLKEVHTKILWCFERLNDPHIQNGPDRVNDPSHWITRILLREFAID